MITRWVMRNWAVLLMLLVAVILVLTLTGCKKQATPARQTVKLVSCR